MSIIFIGGIHDNSTGAEIDRTLGTNIGNLTDNGGLPALFDGLTSTAGASCAARTATTAFGGKTGNIARVISGAIIYGGNNTGFWASGMDPAMTLWLYAKQGSFVNETTGEVLGSISFTDTANESAGRIITSNNLATFWDHWWVYKTNFDGASDARIAEARFFE